MHPPGIGFTHVGHQPHARRIGDREDGSAAPGLQVLARADLSVDHYARERRGDRDLRIDVLGVLERIDLIRGFAEDGQAIAHRLDGGFGGDQIRLSLLPVLQAAALGIVQRMLAGFVRAGQPDLRQRTHQIALRLHELGRLEGGERRSGAHSITQAGDHARDAAGIR